MRLNPAIRIVRSSILISGLFAAAAMSQGLPPTRVGVINFQEALLQTAQMQAESKKLEAKYQPRQDELEQLSRELQELQQKLQSATGSEALELQNQIRRKQRDAQRMQEDLQADVEFDRTEILQSGARTMRDVVSKISEEKGLDLVVDLSNTIFARPALDITNEATAAYDAQNPVE